MVKLKLNREATLPEPEQTRSLRFPVGAVRAMPAPCRSSTARIQESILPHHEHDVMRHPAYIRQIEATLDRMQAGIDQLNEQVDNYKFPDARDEEDRPRAA